VQPTLEIRLLGGFDLLANGQPVAEVNTSRAQSLLACLALQIGAPHQRQQIAFLFWPDSTEARARNNLRQLLHQLRRAWPEADDFLVADANTLGWRPDTNMQSDVAEFEHALALAEAAERQADAASVGAALTRAVELYRGDLLPACYDDWIQPHRTRLRQQYALALTRLVRLFEIERSYATAILFAQRLLQVDPLDEDAYASLMRLRALNGDRAGALHAYRMGETVLQQELDVEPGPALREARDRVLRAEARHPEQSPANTSAWPLVGRSLEWEKLQAAWRRAAAGEPGLALITGEAGIGKSRLAEEMLSWATRQGLPTAKSRAYAAEGRLAFGLVADWLRSDDLQAGLEGLKFAWLSEAARLMPELLDQHADLPRPEPLTEYRQRQRFFEGLARATLAAGQPLLLVADDLQWSDAETLEWLHFLLRFDPQGRLLVVGTARSEDILPDHPLSALVLQLRAAGRVSEISLGPLDAAETASLAAQTIGHEIDEDVALHLFRESEGNPLFVVETVRVGLRHADISPALESRDTLEVPMRTEKGQALPPRVQAVIAARLAQLSSPARELAGLAATIGRAFSFEILALAASAELEKTANSLDELWQRRIVREHSAGTYDFSHDKIREVAYAEITPARRAQLHRGVAQAIETTWAAKLDPVSGQIAAHYEHAAIPGRAIPHYQRAAAVAQRVYASEEAIDLLNRALALNANLPPGPERDATELAIQTGLSVSLIVSRGYASDEAMQASSRAAILAQRLGRSMSPVTLRNRAIAHNGRAEFRQAYELGLQIQGLAERERDPLLSVEAHYVLGVSRFWLGDLASGRVHLERAIALYDPGRSATHLALYSQDPKVTCLSRLAFDLWLLGFPDQAERLNEEALGYARALSHPNSLAYALVWSAMHNYFRREAAKLTQQAEEVIALGNDHSVPFWRAHGVALRGWARAAQEDLTVGLSELQEGMAQLEATGARHMRSYFLLLLAEIYAMQGALNASLSALAEALAEVEQSEGRWCEAEIHWRQGELLQQNGEADAAEAALTRGLEVARNQQARSLELRVALSLAGLWGRQGRQAAAQQVLMVATDWFPEALSTPELAQARALIT
jgi:DNA-binding SARP family transcriptional activator/predicted ATPase